MNRMRALLLVLVAALLIGTVVELRPGGPVIASAYDFLLVRGRGGEVRRWDLSALRFGRVPWTLSRTVGSNVQGARRPFDVIAASFGRWESVETAVAEFEFRGTCPRFSSTTR